MVYRPPGTIALGLDDHAVAHGPHFDGLTFDERYGGKPERPRERSGRGPKFVAEVPRHVTGGVKAPRVVTRPFHKHGRGRGRKTPRLASGSPPPRRVDARLDRDGFGNQPWVKGRVQDGPQGPMVWEVKHPRCFAVGADGWPGAPLRRIVARAARNPAEWKFVVSHAAAETPVDTHRLVAFSRWRVERGFEDQKSAIGLDQYEGRRYQGGQRHLILSGVSALFLSRMRPEFGGKNRERTECPVHTAVAARIPSWWLNLGPPKELLERTAAEIERAQRRNAAARQGHTQRTRRRLRELGIKLTELPRCMWDTTWRCSVRGPNKIGVGITA